MTDKLNILVCENIAKEVSAAVDIEKFNDVRVVTFPARCGRPGISWDELKSVPGYREGDSHVCLIGGCCISGIAQPPETLKYLRIHYLEQCFYMVCNQNICDGYLAKGAYLMTPSWVANWRERIEAWGFDEKTAREFFHETSAELVLIDTGIDPQSNLHLSEFSEFIDLPAIIVPVGLDYLKLFLAKQVYEWRLWHAETESGAALKKSEMKTANYAMALDLLGRIARTNTVADVLAQIIEIFSMLFAPRYLYYLPYKNEKLGDPWPRPPAAVPGSCDGMVILNILNNLKYSYAWMPSGMGFVLRIDQRGKTIGVLVVDEVAFPQYREHYLNLSLDIIHVCVLSFDNVKQYERLKTTQETLRREKEKLQEALAEIKTLSGLLPICSYCKKIRDDRDIWHRIENYIRERSNAHFSHGICPDCMEKYFPEYSQNDDDNPE